ncbi:MAG: 30S ribosome-binding factor RbfA [Alistipes sp.]
METTRQQKIAKQIQKDIADIFQKEGAEIVRGVMITVTAVRVSPDFSYAKIYLSIFPFEKSAAVMETIGKINWLLRKELGRRIKNQIKTIPEIAFFLDDSLEYIDNIERVMSNDPSTHNSQD